MYLQQNLVLNKIRCVKNSAGAELSELPDYLEEKHSFDRKA